MKKCSKLTYFQGTSYNLTPFQNNRSIADDKIYENSQTKIY